MDVQLYHNFKHYREPRASSRSPLIRPGGLLSSKAKRAKCSTHKQRVIIMLYNKVCDIVSNISELLEIQLLTDTTILQVRRKSSSGQCGHCS